MRQVSFDTHEAARKLQRAGHSVEQAAAVVEVVSEATAFNQRMAQDVERIRLQVDNHMATKEDLANVVARMATKEDLADVVARMATKEDLADVVARMATREDLAELRSETRTAISELRSEYKETTSDLRSEIREIRDMQAKTPEMVREILRSELSGIRNGWLVGAGSLLFGVAGVLLALLSVPGVTAFLLEHAHFVSMGLLLTGAAGLFALARQK